MDAYSLHERGCVIYMSDREGCGGGCRQALSLASQSRYVMSRLVSRLASPYVTSGNAAIDRYLFDFMARARRSLACLIAVEFKGLWKSNQTYPGAAILDIWVNGGKNMDWQRSYNSKAEANQRSLKRLIRRFFFFLSVRNTRPSWDSPLCASF